MSARPLGLPKRGEKKRARGDAGPGGILRLSRHVPPQARRVPTIAPGPDPAVGRQRREARLVGHDPAQPREAREGCPRRPGAQGRERRALVDAAAAGVVVVVDCCRAYKRLWN